MSRYNITKSHREDRRKAADLRQAAYNKLSLTEKLSRAGAKQLKKLEVAHGKKSS